jgi:hypothetical protein
MTMGQFHHARPKRLMFTQIIPLTSSGVSSMVVVVSRFFTLSRCAPDPFGLLYQDVKISGHTTIFLMGKPLPSCGP